MVIEFGDIDAPAETIDREVDGASEEAGGGGDGE